jgi:hypothetical protein
VKTVTKERLASPYMLVSYFKRGPILRNRVRRFRGKEFLLKYT